MRKYTSGQLFNEHKRELTRNASKDNNIRQTSEYCGKADILQSAHPTVFFTHLKYDWRINTRKVRSRRANTSKR